MKSLMVFGMLCVAGVCLAVPSEYGARQGKLKPTQLLRSYKGFVNDFYRKNDAYRLEYHVGDSARFEERTDSGEVKGTFAFVAPEGDEYEFKYKADDDGFQVEGEALPEAPEETDDVKAAREAFFEAYEKQLELAGSDEDDSDEDSDESDEYGESSEESDEDDESSEESSEEDDDDDDDDDEEEEEVRRFVSRRQYRPAQSRRQQEPVRQPTSFFTVPRQYNRRS